MLITKEWLKEKSACKEGYEWALKQDGFEDGIDVIKFLNMLVKADHWDWANWVIVRVMTRPQYLAYAIFSAEQVIDIYEKKYPNDDRPRKAIEAAKKVLDSDTNENRASAADAAYASYATAAYAVAASADAASCADDTDDYAADYAADAAYYAAYAVTAAYVTSVSYAADVVLQKKILDYGISLYRNVQ